MIDNNNNETGKISFLNSPDYLKPEQRLKILGKIGITVVSEENDNETNNYLLIIIEY